jgi:hypothetical protein
MGGQHLRLGSRSPATWRHTGARSIPTPRFGDLHQLRRLDLQHRRQLGDDMSMRLAGWRGRRTPVSCPRFRLRTHQRRRSGRTVRVRNANATRHSFTSSGTAASSAAATSISISTRSPPRNRADWNALEVRDGCRYLAPTNPLASYSTSVPVPFSLCSEGPRGSTSTSTCRSDMP